MRHPLKVCGIAALGFALAGCVTAPMDRASTGPSRMGFDGRWGDTTGVAVSTLQGGTFTSTATDTGSVLARGTYRNLSPTRIAIEYTRLSNGDRIAVNCDQMAAERLACVNSTGTRFELTRRA
ncbi:hypothetical protein [Aureimonas frigidaquae]|uniref:hypothetical protein n=1 Tax=Aureimonas frigidaquae TaxID=424757 RepID=UPI000A800B10|nr:hypothetical protein [Aureimonas frigidaquae]